MGNGSRKSLGEMRRIRDAATAAGWTVATSGGNHLRWTPPDGGACVFTSATPSDRRALQNMRRDFRRYGLDI